MFNSAVCESMKYQTLAVGMAGIRPQYRTHLRESPCPNKKGRYRFDWTWKRSLRKWYLPCVFAIPGEHAQNETIPPADILHINVKTRQIRRPIRREPCIASHCWVSIVKCLLETQPLDNLPWSICIAWNWPRPKIAIEIIKFWTCFQGTENHEHWSHCQQKQLNSTVESTKSWTCEKLFVYTPCYTKCLFPKSIRPDSNQENVQNKLNANKS